MVCVTASMQWQVSVAAKDARITELKERELRGPAILKVKDLVSLHFGVL